MQAIDFTDYWMAFRKGITVDGHTPLAMAYVIRPEVPLYFPPLLQLPRGFYFQLQIGLNQP
jgi:hypothetical protein